MGRTGSPNLPEKAQRRAKRLVELYEREAYTIYNLSLRTTADPPAAGRVTETAFLRYIASTATAADSDSPAEQRKGLLKEAVAAALAEAPGRPAKEKPKRGSDDERLLRANAALPGPERASVALISIGETGASAIAAATETTPKAATALAKQARQSFADRAGIPVGKLTASLRDWPWAEPPAEVWESLYPQAERLLAEIEAPAAKRRKAAGSKQAPTPLASRALRGPGLAGLRARLSGTAGIWAFRAGVLAVVLLPAAIVAMTGSGGNPSTSVALSAAGDGSATASAGSGAGTTEGGSTYDALSPKELDQLRLQELDDLRRYSRAQADKSLSAGERSDAEQQALELLALARERLAEAERREQQAAAREDDAKSEGKPAPEPPPTTVTQPAPGKKKKKKGKRKPPPPSGSIDDCLFDEESGTYICPE
jgi:hypothetical protein